MEGEEASKAMQRTSKGKQVMPASTVGAIGHFACNCPNKRNQSARTTTTDNDETIANKKTTDHVAWIKSELASLSQEETTCLTDELEPSQDFPNA